MRKLTRKFPVRIGVTGNRFISVAGSRHRVHGAPSPARQHGNAWHEPVRGLDRGAGQAEGWPGGTGGTMMGRPGTPSLLREINDRAALELLLTEGPLTRSQ